MIEEAGKAFARAFADALHQAKIERGLSQKQLGELIAVRQHARRMPGPEREAALTAAKRLWPPRLSAWKKGNRLPATIDEMCLAMDVIAPNSSRAEWEQRWLLARRDASGFVIGQAEMQPARPAVYLRQVERIAPPELVGREMEIAELAAYCLDATPQPVVGPYVWWRADAWAGKTALLSSFVLHPPAPIRERVRIVSFFVTGRLAAQNTREAFTQALLEQLAHLGGRDIPAALGEAAREAHLLDMLHEEAANCAAVGLRLILIVDGLDEDRGVTTGPDAHSIAALLPADPPSGMRVIVAGRPNPPIPDDVPAWHPLRDRKVRRSLAAIEGAADVERLSQSEVKRLVKGSPLERDVLLLLTAARGGLSGQDLGELTGAELLDVEAVVQSVAGRTFSRRKSALVRATEAEVYQLGHEELHLAATRYLGEDHLATARTRLNDWAGAYRARGWPEGTPEYLLMSHFGLMVEQNHVDRLVDYATDEARHDRLLDISGGDGYALAEIVKVRELLLAGEHHDLIALARLASHEHWLVQRNAAIPVCLPQLFAKLGRWDRARAMVSAMLYPDWQSEALAGLVRVAVDAGMTETAGSLAGQVEKLALQLVDRHAQAVATVAAVESRAAIGDMARAQELARLLTNSYWQSQAVSASVRGAALAGLHGEARRELERLANPLGDVLAVHHARHNALLYDMTQMRAQQVRLLDIHRGMSTIGHHEKVISELAMTAAVAGDRERTHQFVDMLLAAGDSQEIGTGLENPNVPALATAATALASVGEIDRGAHLASRARSVFEQGNYLDDVPILAQLARASRVSGEVEKAYELADKACQSARSGPRPDQLPRDGLEALRWATRARRLALSGDVAFDLVDAELAESLADEAETCVRRARERISSETLSRLALSVDRWDPAVGSASVVLPQSRVQRLLELAEASAEDNPEHIHRELGEVAKAAAVVGDLHRLAKILSRFSGIGATKILFSAALLVAEQGKRSVATELIEQGNSTIASTDVRKDVDLLVLEAKAKGAVGDVEEASLLLREAEQATVTINEPDRRAYKLSDASSVALRLGHVAYAYQLALSSHHYATLIENEHRRAELIGVAAEAMAAAGDTNEAYARAAELQNDSHSRDVAFEGIAAIDAGAGRLDRARARALEISRPHARVQALATVAAIASRNNESLRRARDMAVEAEALAHDVGSAAETDDWSLGFQDSLVSGGPLVSTVATARAATGEFEAAERLIAEVSDSFQRSRAYMAVSEYVTPGLVRRCVAHVLAEGHWELCIPELGLVEPTALAVIVDETLRREGDLAVPGQHT